jgi:SAM-dependent methyltransferase
MARAGSMIDPSYSRGDYFEDPQRHSADARFKADNFLKLFLKFLEQDARPVHSFADVGCGSGDVVKMIADSLRARGFDSLTFKAYDVSPHVLNLRNEGIAYILGDFCESEEFVDVVILFDVFEHVPDPIGFIKGVAERCRMIAFHIPLDDSWNVAMRNRFREKLRDPGHLISMNIVSALNFLTLAGLRVVDYDYTFAFQAPSGRLTLGSRVAFPFRWLLAKANPWLLSRTLGGTSLMVIAATSRGLREDPNE